MTEAMSRTEIEDVLSSIKRLVAHERQVAAPSGQDATSSEHVSEKTEKLVLTQALRVDTPATPPASQPMRAAPREAFQDTSPAAPKAQAHAHNPANNVDESLLSRIARATVSSTAQPQAKDAPLPLRQPVVPPQVAPDDLPEPIKATIEDKALEATLVQLEKALALGPQTTPATTDDDEMVIDEGMLYHMVTQIVRRELQGELGERITRNIRKLVRAEVARELQLRNH